MTASIGIMILLVLIFTRGRIESALNDRFDAAATALVQTKDGNLAELDTSAEAVDDSVWIFDLTGTKVVGPHAGRHVTEAVESLSRVTNRTRLHLGEHRYLAAPVNNDQTDKEMAVVVVAETNQPYEATQVFFIIGLIMLGLAVTAGTGAVAAWTVRRTLDPVNSMAFRAEQWDSQDLESRFDVSATDTEIAHLADTLNVLLDRVAASIRGEQQLTSELAHELRTPLTSIRGDAELCLMESADPGIRDRLTQIVASVDRLSTTITTLVAIARGHDRGGSKSNVAAVLAEILGDRQLPTTLTVDVTGIDAGAEVAAPADLLERALAPLIDNALKYATTLLTVTTEIRERSVMIAVTDDGPGVDAIDPNDLFRAGARSKYSSGAGLGLALSRRVASTLGGDVQLISTANPTTFELAIPQR